MQHDERVVWLLAEPSRKVIQIIEPAPCGFSVTTQWLENGELVRQDCEIAIREGIPTQGQSKGF